MQNYLHITSPYANASLPYGIGEQSFVVGASYFMKTLKCKQCASEFNVKDNRANKAMFCSRNCLSDYNRAKTEWGRKSYMLTLISEAESEVQVLKSGRTQNIRRAICLCDCGNTITTRLTSFMTGYTKSCGCIDHVKHRHQGDANAKYRHPLHRVWSNIVQRCTNKRCHSYSRYGGRGVSICEEWRLSYTSFYEWAIKSGWSVGMEIDKDYLGNGLLYSPNTCRIVTKKENMNRTKRNVVATVYGNQYTMQQIHEKWGISIYRIKRRILNNIPIEPIINDKAECNI